jgi:hypothetical protein
MTRVHILGAMLMTAGMLLGAAHAEVQSRVQSEVQSETGGPKATSTRPAGAAGPFGSGWAKPSGTTGSYIYRDPRLVDPNSANAGRRKTRCPGPLLFNPTTGRCE